MYKYFVKSKGSRWGLVTLLLCCFLSACNNDKQVQSGSAVSSDEKSSTVTTPALGKGSFTNPLFPNGADPWLEYWEGNYYLTTTTWTSELVMRKSPTLAGLADATPVNVWSATDPARCCNFWAFEFHRLKGPNGMRWYMMYTAGQDGTLDYQHLNVLESAGDDPMGPYEYKGALMPDVWNIDGNYLELNDKLYLIYSQWQGDEQLNLITEMDTPWSIKPGSPKVVLTRPELDWEISGRKVTEGAEILQRNGRTFMTYSASFCDTPDYKLGLLELVGDDPLDQAAWKKFQEPVFSRTDKVFGPGHNGFFQSPDGTEEWLVYHGNDSASHGCSSTRSLRAQKFTWNDDGTPNFGSPVTPGDVVAPPSGEDGPLLTTVAGQPYQIVNANSQQCLVVEDGSGNIVQGECSAANVSADKWVLDATTKAFVRLANSHDQGFMNIANCDASGLLDTSSNGVQNQAWHNTACQEWQINAAADGYVSITNRASGLPLAVENCSTSRQAGVVQSSDAACQQWRLQPVGEAVLLSQQSGKAVSVDACNTTEGANIEQASWDHSTCQRWVFTSAEQGYTRLSPANAPALCMAVQNNAMVPGANLQLASCEQKTSQWGIKLNAGGGLSLVNAYTKQVMGLSDCGLADQSNIAQQPDLATKCQVFQLREAE